LPRLPPSRRKEILGKIIEDVHESADESASVSRDAPLVSFESPQVWTRLTSQPAKPGRLLAMVYDNFWYTNF
jgi:hypothetical protein